MAANQVSLKEIKYRGGIVGFSIPSTWKEEYEKYGGGTFYEDAPDSGTLRLNVLTFKTPESEPAVKAIDAIKSLKSITGTPEPISDSGAYCQYAKRSEENGERITIYWWASAQTLNQKYVRILNFSCTILSALENDKNVMNEIELLTEQIKAKLHPEVGE